MATSEGVFVGREGVEFDRLGWVADPNAFGLAAGLHSGAMYLASRAGIHAYLPGGSTREWGPGDGLPKEGASLVIEDGLGRIWAGIGRKLVMKAADAARFTDQSRLLPGSLPPNSQPYLDHDGSVWLPTQNGILHLAGEAAERIDASQGLPFRWARTIFRDREGTLWVVGPSLARLQGGGLVWNDTLSQGATGEVVWWITLDLQKRLRVGTDDGAARAEQASLGGLGVYVNSVMEDSKGRVWLGHTRHGLLRWDSAARRLVRELAPEALGQPTLGIFQVKEDAEGRLWAGSSMGLLLRETDGTWCAFTEKDGLPPHDIRGMAFRPDGTAWLHNREPQGLTRIRCEGGKLKVLERCTHGHGLRTNLIYAVEVDAFGQTWISSDQGIDRLERPVHVGRQEGMVSEDCSIHALHLDGEQVWVGTGGGLVRYEGGASWEPLEPPAARMLQLAFGSTLLEPPIGPLEPIPHQQSTLTFRVAAPAYLHERDLRLQVLSSGWRTPGATWKAIWRVIRPSAEASTGSRCAPPRATGPSAPCLPWKLGSARPGGSPGGGSPSGSGPSLAPSRPSSAFGSPRWPAARRRWSRSWPSVRRSCSRATKNAPPR